MNFTVPIDGPAYVIVGDTAYLLKTPVGNRKWTAESESGETVTIDLGTGAVEHCEPVNPEKEVSFTVQYGTLGPEMEQACEVLDTFAEACRKLVDEHPELLEPVPCPDCAGTGKYTGLADVEACGTCGGKGNQ